MSRISRVIAVGLLGISVTGTGYLQAARSTAAELRGPTPSAGRALRVPQLPGDRLRPQRVSATSAAATAAAAVTPPRDLLDRYCVTCHNQRLKTAGLMLDTLDVEHVASDAETWEKVARKLRTGQMPPAGLPRPDKPVVEALASSLEVALDRAAAAAPNPGRPTVHRLNRTEYANSIHDLLALEIDPRSLLPADDTDQHGFDNNGDVLTSSPALLARYMSAARKISRLAVGRAIAPTIESYSIPRQLVQDDRLNEGLPFGTRGGAAIRHTFPADGEYVVKIRLQANNYGYVRGLADPHEFELRLDRQRIKTFTVGGNKALAAPASYGGTVDGSLEWEKYALTADEGLEARFPVKAGQRSVGVSFTRKFWESEDVVQPRPGGWPLWEDEMFDSNPGVASITIEGPYTTGGQSDTPSRRRIFVCRPRSRGDEESCARTILTTHATRAYRRPATATDIDTLLGFYTTGYRDGGFEAGIQRALERLLVSPDFLFRIENDPPAVAHGAPYRVTDVELASRLSFFLWSSIPDDELLDVAVRGKLKDPAVLERQVRRMLADPRSKALVENFAGQWLVLRNIRDVSPDPDLFPEFDENLRDAFQQETELFVESQLREDHSLVELLSANYTFLNERLARHYEIPNVYGSHFRRVTLSDDRRGGLLTQGSLLTVTSYPNRTSPVLRGKWLLETILGTPPPPPPPDVPALKDKGESGKLASVRERLEVHRKNPACAVCHVRIDPLGFALENFDPIGRWRTIEAGAPIDSSGALPSGETLQGVAGLRQILLAQRELFVGTVTEKLLAYALGRGIQFYDLPSARRITREAAASDYRWSAIILGIVKSAPFEMRRSES